DQVAVGVDHEPGAGPLALCRLGLPHPARPGMDDTGPLMDLDVVVALQRDGQRVDVRRPLPAVAERLPRGGCHGPAFTGGVRDRGGRGGGGGGGGGAGGGRGGPGGGAPAAPRADRHPRPETVRRNRGSGRAGRAAGRSGCTGSGSGGRWSGSTWSWRSSTVKN